MATFAVQMADGSVRQVQGSTLSAAINNAGAGASAPAAGGGGGAAPAAVAVPQTAPAVSDPYGAGQGQWSTINGPRTVPQMAAELAAVGYNGATDPGSVLMAYQRTTGGSIGPTSAAPGVSAAGVTAPLAAGGLGSSDALARAFGLAGTMTQAELDERKRQFDQNLTWTKQMWEQQGLPQLVIQQKASQLAQDEFNFQQQMSQRQQALAEVTGIGGLGLQQQQTALDALKTAASLGGPENFIQAANYARGVQQTQVPAFMQNLVSGVGAPAATGGIGLSAPQTFGGIAARLGGGGTTTAPTTSDLAQTLAMGRQLFTTGGAGLAPQALEGLSDTEQKMLGSVGSAVGADVPAFLKSYAASRIGQGAAQAA